MVRFCVCKLLKATTCANLDHLGLARTTHIYGVYIGLARTIYIRCVFGIFGREITIYTVYVYGSGQLYVYTVFLAGKSPNVRCIHTVLANPSHLSV